MELFEGVSATNLQELRHLTNPNLPSNARVEHEIKLNKGSVPIKQKNRGIPYNYRDEFRASVEEMLDAKMIKHSKSPFSSPVRLVNKKDGKIRVCVDYRKVNALTVKDSYPIPRIEVLFSFLTFATVFTVLDLTSGYYQVPMEATSTMYRD